MSHLRVLLPAIALSMFAADGGAQTECFRQLLSNPYLSTDTYTGGPLSVDDDRLAIGRSNDPNFTGTGAGSVFVFERDASGWNVAQRIVPSDATVDGGFGRAVALDGDLLVVRGEGYSTGVLLGSMYVFRLVGGTWVEETKLQLPFASSSGFAFASVALSAGRIAVGLWTYNAAGVNQAGTVIVYEEVGGAWVAVETLTANPPTPSGRFGAQVDLSGDVLVVKASAHPRGSGFAIDQTAFVYRRGLAGWALETSFQADDLAPNSSELAVGVSGNQLGLGSRTTNGGHFDLFRYAAGAWSHEERFSGTHSNASFGGAFDFDGDRLLIGDPNPGNGGHTRLFEKVEDTWVSGGSFVYDAFSFEFGNQVAFANGGEDIISVRTSLQVGVWARPGRRWSYGLGTPGANGYPTLAGQGCVAPDYPQSLVVTNGPAFGTGLLVVTQAQGSTPLAGGTLLVGGALFTTAPHNLSFDGRGVLPFALDTALFGSTFYSQALYLDAGAPAGVAMTNGLRLDFF